jgi:hypothetical protein
MGIWSIIRYSYFAYVESVIGLAPSVLRSSIPLDVTAETNLVHKPPKISNDWAGFVVFSFKPQIRTIKINAIEGRTLLIEPFAFNRWENHDVESGVLAELSHVMEPNFSLGITNYIPINQSPNISGGAAPSSTNQVDGQKI